jgi:membrane-bound ClpP family serine protease
MIDIRLPIGGLFAVLGAMLIVFGAVGDPAKYAQSLGVNVNLYWGIVMLIFGLVMLALGRRANRRSDGGGAKH